MVVKGDTLEYNATAFKTPENAMVEELLKKLPGVEISSEGKSPSMERKSRKYVSMERNSSMAILSKPPKTFRQI